MTPTEEAVDPILTGAMGPAPFWSLKPAKKLHPSKRKHKPKRLGSLEAWRSDKILEAAQQRMIPKKSPPRLQIDPLSVVGSKPTASSPLYAQLPGSRASPQASPTSGTSQSPNKGSPSSESKEGEASNSKSPNSVAFPSPTGTPGGIRHQKEIEQSPSANNASSPNSASPEGQVSKPASIDLGGSATDVTGEAGAPVEEEGAPGTGDGQDVAEEHPISVLEEDVLIAKLMETEMTLRVKFESGKELRRVQEKVCKGLEFLGELPSLAENIGIIEGLLFQELLARLNAASPAMLGAGTVTTPASPTLRALRQENRCLAGSPQSNKGRPLVNRTPLPGQAHPAGASPQPQRPVQASVDAISHEKQQVLIRETANLRSLLRIKIEDNGDLALAKTALQDAKLVFQNVWARAADLPEDNGGQPEQTSWPPSPGENPSLDRRAAQVLLKLRSLPEDPPK